MSAGLTDIATELWMGVVEKKEDERRKERKGRELSSKGKLARG